MHIMFVCTGNICRSPIGELLMRHYLAGTSVVVDSAGTHGLTNHAIDPFSRELMDEVGIESREFRSRRLTADMARSADLILCFEKEQLADIKTLAPTMGRRVFLLPDFANLATSCAERGLIQGLTVPKRMESIITQAPRLIGVIPTSDDIEDPHRKSFDVFERACKQTNAAIVTILDSLRKHYRRRSSSAIAQY
ncbi:MAG: low molecular weight phosphatase family protein [Bifidobacterium aquikefiri]|uniref:Protein-tyrosine-phosphatase n=1 Tax=Bifidobacterium aquikefiri TaxID=1653207 RepID=A0A261G2E9_9BIFI|nr:low molecular weight phosphatase family protein [Bifidobacterium aquikefiri]OZG65602.1 protein-tyrosine-phosphatase [Bifidobacterium aquikefiri]